MPPRSPSRVAGLRVLVVDDERPARRKIRMLLEASVGIDAIYEAPDGNSALAVVHAQRPDLMFIDVRMPGMDGLAVVESLDADTAPHVVFVTAFDEHALRAFDLHAVDYLLKPFDPHRFGVALERARQAVVNRDARAEVADLRRALVTVRADVGAPLDRLLVEDGHRMVLIRLVDVERIESDRNYVVLHSAGRTFRARTTMAALETRIDARRFARVSRGTIVNLDHVASLDAAGHGDFDVRLRSHAVVRLSRRYRDRLDSFQP